MAAAVLRSHDALKNRLHLDFYGYRTPPPMTPTKSPSPSRKKPQSRARSKPSPTRLARKLSGSPAGKENSPSRNNHLVMGQVTILKRGDALKPLQEPSTSAALRSDFAGDASSSSLCSTERLGPDPGVLPKIGDLKPVYAGPSAFGSSPSPDELPYPDFLKKNADATRGLRFLLRLDAAV